MTARPAQARPPRSPRLTAAVVAFAGMLNLISVAVPAERARLRLLTTWVPGALVTTAAAATAASGVGLLLLAGGLRRRCRSALLATIALLLSGAVFHLLKGLDLEDALVEAFLGGLLVGKADRFSARAGPNERRPVLRPAIAVVLLTLGVGLLGLLANRDDVDGILTVASALWEVARLAVGLPGPLGLDGWFGRLFPATIMAMFLVGAGLVVLRLLAPRSAADAPTQACPTWWHARRTRWPTSRSATTATACEPATRSSPTARCARSRWPLATRSAHPSSGRTWSLPSWRRPLDKAGWPR